MNLRIGKVGKKFIEIENNKGKHIGNIQVTKNLICITTIKETKLTRNYSTYKQIELD